MFLFYISVFVTYLLIHNPAYVCLSYPYAFSCYFQSNHGVLRVRHQILLLRSDRTHDDHRGHDHQIHGLHDFQIHFHDLQIHGGLPHDGHGPHGGHAFLFRVLQSHDGL